MSQRAIEVRAVPQKNSVLSEVAEVIHMHLDFSGSRRIGAINGSEVTASVRKTVQAAILTICLSIAGSAAESNVRTLRLPQGGLQPQVMQQNGVLHVIYFSGESKQGDVLYIRSDDGGRSFSKPIRVNSQPGSGVATGTIRGPQLAVGRDGQVHVSWNGSSIAQPRGPLNPDMPSDSPHNGLPMLYSRLGSNGRFSPQRNLMQATFGLDGGESIAADHAGNVYVTWHGKAPGANKGEAGRRVWLTKSSDDGETFREERPVFGDRTGACACCGMKLSVDSRGNLALLYRSAREVKHRDVYLLASSDNGETFQGRMLDPWQISACPMTSMSLVENQEGMMAAWETAGQVLFTQIGSGRPKFEAPIAAPGLAGHRKHPRVAVNQRGETLVAWSVVEGWGKSGTLHWQVFDAAGKAVGETAKVEDLPAWSFGTVSTLENGSFAVIF